MDEGSIIHRPQETRKSKIMQVFLGLITNITNLAPGMSLGFSAIALPVMTSVVGPERINEDQASWIASSAAITMPIGCLISGPILDKFGRKICLYVVNILSLIGWIFIASAVREPSGQYAMILIGRVITGIATGMGSIPATVYLSEISTPKLRGMLATWTSVSIAQGILIIYVLGYFLKENWRISAGITAAIPALALILIFFIMPESPQWLVNKNRLEESKKSLATIWRTSIDSPYITEEVNRIIELKFKTKAKQNATTANSFGMKVIKKTKYFLKPNCIKPFGILVSFFFFQQFSGTFVIVFYAVNIVRETGVTIDPYLAAIYIGLARSIASLFVGSISKRYGRRPPSIFSGISMSISMICLALYLYFASLGIIAEDTIQNLNWLPVTLVLIYFFTSTIGFLTMPFAMIAEMYPTKVRGLAGGLTAFLCYLFNFIAVKLYPDMVENMGKSGVFGFYGGVALVGTIFIILLLPETKGKSLSEIEEYFSGNKVEKIKTEKTELNTVTLSQYVAENA